MNGEALYQIYAQLNASICDCDVDFWDDLSDEDQEVWNQLAVRVRQE